MSDPDFNPEDEQSINATLEGEFTRPPALFQNRPLWPFTKGSKALYNMTLSDADTVLYRILAFIFIHIRGGEKDMESDLSKRIVPLIWSDVNKFRVRALSLLDNMTNQDIQEAFSVVNKELSLEKATEIKATPPDYGATQKKSRPTTRRKSDGKRSAQQKS